MKIKTVMIATVGVATLATTTQSCLALATSSIGLSILKQILLGGITKGLGIFADKNAFLQNNLIDQALPSELRQINSVLEKIAPSLVQKEREYIAEAAAYTVNIAEPILVNAVNSLTAEDVQRVANGGKGASTMLLKEKTAEQLMLAIQPKVDQKLNEFGIVSSINMALQGNQILASILGSNSAMSATSPLSRLASEQLVNGLFKLVEQHEQQNSIQLLDAIQKQ